MRTRGKPVSRRAVLQTGAVTVAAGTVGCIGDNGADNTAESVEIVVADFVPEQHHIRQDNLLPWVERVEELAENDVNFELHFAGELGEATELLSMARDGVVDIALVSAAYFSEFQLTEVTHLPATFLDTEVAAGAFWEMAQGTLYDEELEPLGIRAVHATLEPNYQLATVDREVIKLDDWEGLNVRSPGGIGSSAIEALGGTPVDIATGDVHSAFESGTIDANIAAANTFYVFDQVPFLEHVTSNVNLGSFASYWAMNEDIWQDLPGDVQDAMAQAASEVVPDSGATFDQNESEMFEILAEEEDMNVYEVPTDIYDEWEETLQPVHEEWIENVEGKGLPGQEAYDEFTSGLE